MKSLPYIFQGKNIIVVVNNKSHTITETNIGYSEIKYAIKCGEWDAVAELLNVNTVIEKYANNEFEVVDGVLFDNDIKVSNAISDRMYDMYVNGFDVNPLLKFYKNIKLNPSQESIKELYSFLENNSLPITEDGCFVAYKRVQENYMDVYSGTMNNSVGKTLTMDRSKVDANRNKTCSTGLHFCSVEYLRYFHGGKTVIVKINPRDVVSIPTDYNNAKGRCCKYEVIGEMTNEEVERDQLSTAPVYQNESYSLLDNMMDKVELENVVDFDKVYTLGLRDQTKIWNELTGGTLKKFSYRKDVNRRMYDNQYTAQEIVQAAAKLKLI